MAKTPSQKLFSLIKSLTSSERRYFKIAVNPTGDRDNKYAKLFDLIRAQNEFDDSALQLEIYGHKQTETRKFSELKNYLYHQILKSLQSFDEKTSVEYRVKNYLMNVKVLFKRSLFSDCVEELEKAKKLADKYELFDVSLKILNLEKEIAYARTDIRYLDENLAQIAEKETNLLANRNLEIDLRNLFFELLIELRKDASRSPEQMDRLKLSGESDVLKKIPENPPFRISVIYFRIKTLLSFAKSDFVDAYENSTRLLEIMESKKHFLKEDVSEYISAVNNHLISCGQLAKYDEVEQNLIRIKAIQPISNDDRLKIHGLYFMNKFRLCIEKGDFEDGLSALENHEEEVKKYPSFYFPRVNFYFQYFNIYFGAEDFENALIYLNEWLNQPKNVERKDLQALARVLNLLVHYEMKNELLLDSLLRSTTRYLKKEKRIYQFEYHIISFFRDTVSKPLTKKGLKERMELLTQQFNSLLQSPQEARMMRAFDFPAWIESKIRQEKFGVIVSERFEKKLAASFRKSDG